MSRTMLLCLNWFGFWIRRFDFNDAVCVVTGGSSGIGRCLAIELAHRGANVIVVARRKERLAKLENQFDRIHAVVGDITNEDDWTRIRDAAASLSDSGEIDLLVTSRS
ncbi:MAG: SDR family oxidoreductase, partial [Planctomycetota bacterium]